MNKTRKRAYKPYEQGYRDCIEVVELWLKEEQILFNDLGFDRLIAMLKAKLRVKTLTIYGEYIPSSGFTPPYETPKRTLYQMPENVYERLRKKYLKEGE